MKKIETWKVVLIVLGILCVAGVVLYFVYKRAQKRYLDEFEESLDDDEEEDFEDFDLEEDYDKKYIRIHHDGEEEGALA